MEAATRFLAGVVAHPDVRRQMSRDHFSVDGTLIEAWASMKSFRPKDEDRDDEGGGEAGGSGRNAGRDFRGETRSNESHASTTDPDARLYRKAAGQPSRLCFIGTALMETAALGGHVSTRCDCAECGHTLRLPRSRKHTSEADIQHSASGDRWHPFSASSQ